MRCTSPSPRSATTCACWRKSWPRRCWCACTGASGSRRKGATLDDCTRGFDTLTVALRRLKQTDANRPLVISVAPYFSARWLMPRLGSLWSRHPKLELQLRHAYQPADFLHHSVDGGISFRGLLAEDLQSGLLHAPFAVDVDPGSAYYFVKPRGRPAPRSLEQFERWLAARGRCGFVATDRK